MPGRPRTRTTTFSCTGTPTTQHLLRRRPPYRTARRRPSSRSATPTTLVPRSSSHWSSRGPARRTPHCVSICFPITDRTTRYRVSAGRVTEPATSRNVFAAGAICHTNNALEGYSSLGPTIDGRIKPDIAAYDSVSNTVFGNFNGNCGASGFTGTSASSPATGGAAALVKQAIQLHAGSGSDFLQQPCHRSRDRWQGQLVWFGRTVAWYSALPPIAGTAGTTGTTGTFTITTRTSTRLRLRLRRSDVYAYYAYLYNYYAYIYSMPRTPHGCPATTPTLPTTPTTRTVLVLRRGLQLLQLGNYGNLYAYYGYSTARQPRCTTTTLTTTS